MYIPKFLGEKPFSEVQPIIEWIAYDQNLKISNYKDFVKIVKIYIQYFN
jgi:hypothetical protein